MTILAHLDSPVACVYKGKCHKAAIALNNTAVGLLLRGFYRDALDTFQDAIKLIKFSKFAADPENGAVVPAKDSLEEVLRLPLQQAWQRAAFPRGNQCDINPSKSAKSVCILKAVSSEYDPTTMNEALICAGSHSNTKFPMTIDPIDFESTSDMATAADFHCSVLLYNFAIAYECWATTTTDRKEYFAQEPFPERVRAYRIFQLSRSVLVQQYQNYREKVASNFHAVEKIIQLNLLLTDNLIEASSHLSMPLQYQEHCKDMDELLHLIKSGELLLPTTEHRAARAA